MNPTFRSVLFGCAILSIGALNAEPAQDSAHHHHHLETSAEHEELGRVSFPTSCNENVQRSIERGIALLHSFGYTEARAQFEAVVRDDPGCAMAHWGVAMTQFQEIWGP